jgi:hypothetical protein
MTEKQDITEKIPCSIDDDISEQDTNNEELLVKSPEEIAFIKKLNWKILPLVFLVIFIQVKLCLICVQYHDINAFYA